MTTSSMTKLPDRARRRRLVTDLARAEMTFDAAVLELLVARDPDDLEALVNLAQVCARLGRHRRGLSLDRKLVEARPNEPTFRYNLACSLALTGDLNAACGDLLVAIDIGYRDFEHLMADDDLAELRQDNRFVLVRDRMASEGFVLPAS